MMYGAKLLKMKKPDNIELKDVSSQMVKNFYKDSKKVSNKKMKNDIVNKGIIKLKSGQYEYPITYQLIKDGKKNKVLHKKIKTKINVTMIHGNKDESVPVIFSKKVLKIFRGAKKKLIIIKKGDHSLSKKPYLKRIIKELDEIILNVA